MLIVATGCAGAGGTADSDSNNQRYIAGTGKVQAVPSREREPAPILRGETVDGKRLSTAAYRGRVIVVNFWASWCPPCRAEAESLQIRIADGADAVELRLEQARVLREVIEWVAQRRSARGLDPAA